MLIVPLMAQGLCVSFLGLTLMARFWFPYASVAPALRVNEHRRNLDLGSQQRSALDSRGDCVGDSGAVDTTPTAFHGAELVVLTGRPWEKVLSLHLWLRFAALWFAVVLIGCIEGYVLLSFGLASFLGGVFLTALLVWRVAPKWLR